MWRIQCSSCTVCRKTSIRNLSSLQDLKRYLYKQLQRCVYMMWHAGEAVVLSHYKRKQEKYCLFSSPSVEGLHAIVVTDRDGVPVIKGKALSSIYPHWYIGPNYVHAPFLSYHAPLQPHSEGEPHWYMVVLLGHCLEIHRCHCFCVPVVANDNAPVHALRPGFLSTFALATDQGSKLGLSKNKSIICYYNTYQVRRQPPTITRYRFVW